MIKRAMKTLNIADIHSGENKTTAKHIYEIIQEYLTHSDSDLTHLFVCGDFTHRQLTASSEEYQYTKKTFLYIVNFCIKHSIKLRFLEGTPSHDYKQIETLSLSVPDTCDFKYFKDVEIEYDKEYGAYILYVPDEMGDTTHDVLFKIKEKMKILGITYIDIAIIHGSFTFHMPGKLSFDIEDFAFVRYYIAIGHNHTKSIVGNIITPGSLDRNFYGEEDDKGGYVIKLSPFHYELTVLFKKNHNSHRLDTLDLKTCNSEEALKRLIHKLKTYPSKYLRIDISGNTNIDKSILHSYAKEHHIHLDVKSKKEEKQSVSLALTTTFKDLNITKENIIPLILEEINQPDKEYVTLLKELV